MKYLIPSLLLLSILITLTSGCSVEDNITPEYMIDSVMGHTVRGIDGSWTFDGKEEFLDYRIISQVREEKKLKVDVEFILEDMDDEDVLFLHTLLDFRLIDKDWIFIQGRQLEYKQIDYRRLKK